MKSGSVRALACCVRRLAERHPIIKLCERGIGILPMRPGLEAHAIRFFDEGVENYTRGRVCSPN